MTQNRLNGLFLSHYLFCLDNINYITNSLNIVLRKFTNYDKLINCLIKIDLLENVFILNDAINFKLVKFENVNRKCIVLNELVNKGILKDNLQIILTNSTLQMDFINKAIKSINYNTKLINLYNLRDKLDTINGYFFEQNQNLENIKNLHENFNKLKYRFDHLHLEYNLQPCNHCGGIGFCN